MHRAGIERALRHRFRRGYPLEIAGGVRFELFPARGRAKVKPLSGVLCHMPSARALDLHSTNRIFRLDIVLRRGLKLLAASRTTEMEDVPLMLIGRFARLRIDGHRANRVQDRSRLLVLVIVSLRLSDHGVIAPFNYQALSDLRPTQHRHSTHWKVKADGYGASPEAMKRRPK